MVKERRKIELGDALERYFKPNIGPIPIMIVDTSTIIDLEEKARGFSTRAYGKVASVLLSDLAKPINYVIIPQEVMHETENHHRHSIKNGRPEISKEMYASLLGYASHSKNLIDETKEFFKDSKEHSEIFKNLESLAKNLHKEINEGKKKKKTERDPLSETDMGVIGLSLKFAIKSSAHLHEEVSEKGEIPEVLRGTYRIAVLSADSHIYKPINKILETSEGFPYRDYLFAFNTREYL